MATAEEWVHAPHKQPAATGSFGAHSTTSRPLIIHAATALTVAAVVGTGGAMTFKMWEDLYARGYRVPRLEVERAFAAPRATAHQARGALALATIRDVMAVSVSALAKSFAVSRQAIYQWQRGEGISEKNVQRLLKLEAAALHLATRGVPGEFARTRVLQGGKTILQLIATEPESDPIELVDALERLLRAEAEDRKRLAALLGNRKREPVDFDEIAPTYLDDKS